MHSKAMQLREYKSGGHNFPTGRIGEDKGRGAAFGRRTTSGGGVGMKKCSEKNMKNGKNQSAFDISGLIGDISFVLFYDDGLSVSDQPPKGKAYILI